MDTQTEQETPADALYELAGDLGECQKSLEDFCGSALAPGLLRRVKRLLWSRRQLAIDLAAAAPSLDGSVLLAAVSVPAQTAAEVALQLRQVRSSVDRLTELLQQIEAR